MSKYFISYVYQNPGHSGNGNAVIVMPKGIESIDDIGVAEKQLTKDLGYRNVIIQSFIEIMPDCRCEEDKIAEAKSEMKEEILTYLRDCRDDLGCPGPESRALDRHIDFIKRRTGD